MICKKRTFIGLFIAAVALSSYVVYSYYRTPPDHDDEVVIEEVIVDKIHKKLPIGGHRRHINPATYRSNDTTCKGLEQRLNIGPRRYVLGLNYWEQTNMALGSMFALERVAVDWGARLVRPFTLNSRLYGLPHLRIDDHWDDHAQCHTLDLLFNLTYMDKVGCSYSLPHQVKFEDFLRNASRQLTILHFIHEIESREFSVLKESGGHEIKRRLEKEHIFECSELLSIVQNILPSLNEEASTHKLPPFVLDKHYCINSTISTSPADLARKCAIDQQKSSASIIVLNWRGLNANKMVLKSARGQHKNARLPLRNMTLEWHPAPTTEYFQHSNLVLQNVGKFMTDLSLSPYNFIGIHIRSEKLGQRESRIPNYSFNCLGKALKIRNQLLKHANKETIIFTDYGKFGSDSCENCKGAHKTKEFLSTYKLLSMHFNPTNYDAVADSGLVAAVEMDTLAAADHLILVGGGAFQKQLGIKFRNKEPHIKKKRSKHRVHMVCWDDLGKVKPFRKTVNSPV